MIHAHIPKVKWTSNEVHIHKSHDGPT